MVDLSTVVELRLGQNTSVFRRHLLPDRDQLSFSLIFSDGKRSLDLICDTAALYNEWVTGLKALIGKWHEDASGHVHGVLLPDLLRSPRTITNNHLLSVDGKPLNKQRRQSELRLDTLRRKLKHLEDATTEEQISRRKSVSGGAYVLSEDTSSRSKTLVEINISEASEHLAKAAQLIANNASQPLVEAELLQAEMGIENAEGLVVSH
eukprot:GILI01036709.1.p1 GENE.GILI01036709.1~~GILI01036709.1.p1  ORF type:complete len:230 (+),score=58.73 GILI01036709.1:70-690(+)